MEQLMEKSEYLWDMLANETDTWKTMYLRQAVYLALLWQRDTCCA